MKYITNGVEQKMIKNDQELPDGFYYGRLPISEETRQKYIDSHKGKKLSKESIEKRQKTFSEKYGVNSCSQLPDVKTKISEKLSSYEVQEKMKKTNLEKYGCEHVLQNKEIQAKMRMTNLKLHGDMNYNNKDKEYETRKLNNTLGLFETKPEQELFKLLEELYGNGNVFKLYRTKEYPFKCDFYIKDIDVYIEYNGYFTHNGHPFDKDNDKDNEQYQLLKSKSINGDKWSESILYTWTDLDVRKSSYKDKVNLIMFYPDKQDDIVSSFKKLKAELDSYNK